MKILVVEDDPLIRRSLCELVEAWGYACDDAADGLVAWELLQACPYDLVLLDLNLPGLDGLSLCRRLRAAGGHQPLLLMLTSRDTNLDHVVGLDQGADEYMVKPFDPDLLRANVRALLRRASRPLCGFCREPQGQCGLRDGTDGHGDSGGSDHHHLRQKRSGHLHLRQWNHHAHLPGPQRRHSRVLRQHRRDPRDHGLFRLPGQSGGDLSS